MRKRVKGLIRDLATANPKVPSNMLHALSSIRVSQLMDKRHWNFDDLEINTLNEPVVVSTDLETDADGDDVPATFIRMPIVKEPV